jgi:iron(III) transport system substrate-binding protein
MTQHRRWAAGGLAAATVILGLTACGAAPGTTTAKATTDVFTKYGAMSPAQRDPQLAKLAAKEGPVDVYTSFQDMDKLGAAFSKKYPGVKTTIYRADSETVFAKAQQEAAAHSSHADVIETDGVLMDELVKQGTLTTKYKVDPSNFVADAVHPGWIAARFKAFFVSWNTNKVTGADIPTSYQDLENPKWKGKLAIEVGDFSWYRGLYDYFIKQGMSPSAVTSMWEKIASNARVVKGHTQTAALLASGEYSIFVDSYDDGILALKAKKAPVAFRDSSGQVPVQPVFTNSTGIGVLANAPDPAGAMLFTDFFLSQQGQQMVNDLGNIPAYKGINHELDGVKTTTASLADESSKAAQDAYTALLKHASSG